MAENQLSRDVREAGEDVQYDAQVKNVLKNKIILAWILRYTVEPFSQMTPEEIMPYIEADQEAMTPCRRPEKITGSATEDTSPGAATVIYDIKFWVSLPEGAQRSDTPTVNTGCETEADKTKIHETGFDETAACKNIKRKSPELAKVIINVEAQKKFNPGYCIESRGVFYCSRMISSQLGTEFQEPHYDGIKKVYSIWLCMNAPAYAGGAIAEYAFRKRDILPGMKDRRWAYDKQAVILICLNEKAAKGNRLTRMLDTLLSRKINFETKKKRLEKEYGICMESQMETEVMELCNLSILVREEGRREGRESVAMEMLRLHRYGDEEILLLSKISRKRLAELKTAAAANQINSW